MDVEFALHGNSFLPTEQARAAAASMSRDDLDAAAVRMPRESAVRMDSIDTERGTAEFVISTDLPTVDSWWAPPASLRAEGIDTSRYLRNPVVLHLHDYNRVVGRTVEIRTEGNANIARVEFDLEDETGKRVFGQIRRGFLRMASVGYRKREWYDVEKDKTDETTGLRGPVRVVTRWEMLEWSTVSVGANPDALGRMAAMQDSTVPPVRLPAQRFSLHPQKRS